MAATEQELDSGNPSTEEPYLELRELEEENNDTELAATKQVFGRTAADHLNPMQLMMNGGYRVPGHEAADEDEEEDTAAEGERKRKAFARRGGDKSNTLDLVAPDNVSLHWDQLLTDGVGQAVFAVFGPLGYPFLLWWYGTKTALLNREMQLPTSPPMIIRQLIFWAPIPVAFTLYYTYQDDVGSDVDFFEFGMVWFGLVMRISTVVAKYAYMHPPEYQKLLTKIDTRGQTYRQFLSGWLPCPPGVAEVYSEATLRNFQVAGGNSKMCSNLSKSDYMVTVYKSVGLEGRGWYGRVQNTGAPGECSEDGNAAALCRVARRYVGTRLRDPEYNPFIDDYFALRQKESAEVKKEEARKERERKREERRQLRLLEKQKGVGNVDHDVAKMNATKNLEGFSGGLSSPVQAVRGNARGARGLKRGQGVKDGDRRLKVLEMEEELDQLEKAALAGADVDMIADAMLGGDKITIEQSIALSRAASRSASNAVGSNAQASPVTSPANLPNGSSRHRMGSSFAQRGSSTAQLPATVPHSGSVVDLGSKPSRAAPSPKGFVPNGAATEAPVKFADSDDEAPAQNGVAPEAQGGGSTEQPTMGRDAPSPIPDAPDGANSRALQAGPSRVRVSVHQGKVQDRIQNLVDGAHLDSQALRQLEQDVDQDAMQCKLRGGCAMNQVHLASLFRWIVHSVLAEEKQSRFVRRMPWAIFGTSLLIPFIPAVVRVYEGSEPFGDNWKSKTVAALLVPQQFFTWGVTLAFAYTCLLDSLRRLRFMKCMTALLSSDRMDRNSRLIPGAVKWYGPTLNMHCGDAPRHWLRLRRMTLHFGVYFYRRIEFFIGLLFGAGCVLALAFLYLVEVRGGRDLTRTSLVLVSFTILELSSFIAGVVWIGNEINDTYYQHAALLARHNSLLLAPDPGNGQMGQAYNEVKKPLWAGEKKEYAVNSIQATLEELDREFQSTPWMIGPFTASLALLSTFSVLPLYLMTAISRMCDGEGVAIC